MAYECQKIEKIHLSELRVAVLFHQEAVVELYRLVK